MPIDVSEKERFSFCCPHTPDPSCVLTFPAGSRQYSHYVAAPGFVLVERGGEQLRLAGEVQESLGEAAVGASFTGRLDFAHAC